MGLFSLSLFFLRKMNVPGQSHMFYIPVIVSFELIPLAARSIAWICGHLTAEIVGSNPTGSMDVCLL
jgi:hypothetical protein